MNGPTRPLRPQWSRPPGDVKDCATCRHWRPGTVVLRGSTQGLCGFDPNNQPRASADQWCDQHEEQPGAG